MKKNLGMNDIYVYRITNFPDFYNVDIATKLFISWFFGVLLENISFSQCQIKHESFLLVLVHCFEKLYSSKFQLFDQESALILALCGKFTDSYTTVSTLTY